jgi:hypothetical protein
MQVRQQAFHNFESWRAGHRLQAGTMATLTGFLDRMLGQLGSNQVVNLSGAAAATARTLNVSRSAEVIYGQLSQQDHAAGHLAPGCFADELRCLLDSELSQPLYRRLTLFRVFVVFRIK